MKNTTDLSKAADAGLHPDALARLSAVIRSYVDDGRQYGASIIVARGGKVGLRENIGTVAPGRNAADDDLYLMMSVSKSFTAALVLRAIDQGRFTLDTRVAEIIPAFAAGGKQRATIRHLLTHQAGTYDGLLSPPPLTLNQWGDLEKNVQAFCALPAAYVPGERVAYSPIASYGLLGQILVLTDPAKRSFGTLARQDLFEPLGMKDMRFGLALNEPRRVPVSFTPKNTKPNTAVLEQLLNVAVDEHSEVPAGNAFGTAQDLFHFAEALRQRGDNGNYRLMSQALFDYAAQNHTGEKSNGTWDFYREAFGMPDFPANFSLLGGYARGQGHFIHGCGTTASPSALCAIGGGSTMWMVDPARDLTFVFLSAGFIEGLAHLERLQRLSDLALAACVD